MKSSCYHGLNATDAADFAMKLHLLPTSGESETKSEEKVKNKQVVNGLLPDTAENGKSGSIIIMYPRYFFLINMCIVMSLPMLS